MTLCQVLEAGHRQTLCDPMCGALRGKPTGPEATQAGDPSDQDVGCREMRESRSGAWVQDRRVSRQERAGALGTAASLASVALGGALLGHPAAKPADGSQAAALGTTWHQCRGPDAPAARLQCAATPPPPVPPPQGVGRDTLGGPGLLPSALCSSGAENSRQQLRGGKAFLQTFI